MSWTFTPTLESAQLLSAPPPAGGGLVKAWTGSEWAAKPLKVWTGSEWATKPMKHWTGAVWAEAQG